MQRRIIIKRDASLDIITLWLAHWPNQENYEHIVYLLILAPFVGIFKVHLISFFSRCFIIIIACVFVCCVCSKTLVLLPLLVLFFLQVVLYFKNTKFTFFRIWNLFYAHTYTHTRSTQHFNGSLKIKIRMYIFRVLVLNVDNLDAFFFCFLHFSHANAIICWPYVSEKKEHRKQKNVSR